MPLSPKLPKISGGLVLLTYATFGWLLYGWTTNRGMWLAAAFGAIVLGALAAYPGRSIELGLTSFFGANAKAFILMIFASVFSVVLLTWLQFFADAILLFTAGLLFSLDLKFAGWKKRSRLLIIIGWQLLGMSIGLGIHHLVLNPELMPVYLSENFKQYLPPQFR
jgi:hypothetical protein